MKKTNKIIITAIITAVIFASMAGCVMDKQTKQAVSDLNSVISSISKTVGESSPDKKDDSTTNNAEESVDVTDDDQTKNNTVSETSINETDTIDPELTQIETSDTEVSDVNVKETSKQNSVVQKSENSKSDKKETSVKETSKTETSKADTGKQENSKAEDSKVETSKQETSKAETSRQEASKVETSKTETSRQETSKTETSKQENSREESSKQETSQQNPVETKKTIKNIVLTAPVNGGEYRFVTMDVYPAGADISALKVSVTPFGKNIKITREIDGVQCGLADDSYKITYDLEPYTQDTWITIRVTDGNITKEVKTEVRAKRTVSAAYYTPYDPEQIVKDFRAYGEKLGMTWYDGFYIKWNNDRTEYTYNTGFNFPTCTQTTTDGINLYNEMVDQFTWLDNEAKAQGGSIKNLCFKIVYAYDGYDSNFKKEKYEFYLLTGPKEVYIG